MDGSPSSFVPEVEAFPVIERERMDRGLTDYLRALVRALAEQNPSQHPSFVRDFKIDKRRPYPQLKESLPNIPGRNAQAEKFLHIIDDAVHASKTVEPMPGMILRVAVDSAPMAPQILLEPHEPTTTLSFDSIRGVRTSCFVPATDEPPPLGDLGISAGVIVIGQPLSPVMGHRIDNNPLFLAGGPSMYNTDRNRDPLLGGGDEGFFTPISISYPLYLKAYSQFVQIYDNYNPADPSINLSHYPEIVREAEEERDREKAARLALAQAGAATAVEAQRIERQREMHARNDEAKTREETVHHQEETVHRQEISAEQEREVEEATQEKTNEAIIQEKTAVSEEIAVNELAEQTAAAETELTAAEGIATGGPQRPEFITPAGGPQPASEVESQAAVQAIAVTGGTASNNESLPVASVVIAQTAVQAEGTSSSVTAPEAASQSVQQASEALRPTSVGTEQVAGAQLETSGNRERLPSEGLVETRQAETEQRETRQVERENPAEPVREARAEGYEGQRVSAEQRGGYARTERVAANESGVAGVAVFSANEAQPAVIHHGLLHEAALHQTGSSPAAAGYSASFVTTPDAASHAVVHHAALHALAGGNTPHLASWAAGLTPPSGSASPQVGSIPSAHIVATSVAGASPSAQSLSGLPIAGAKMTGTGTIKAKLTELVAPFLLAGQSRTAAKKERISARKNAQLKKPGFRTRVRLRKKLVEAKLTGKGEIGNTAQKSVPPALGKQPKLTKE